MKTRLDTLWDSLRASYWFLPMLMAIAAGILAYFASEIDRRYPDLLQTAWSGAPTGGPDGAREVLSTIAGSMITVAGVTFSIMIVALSNTSSQFGPRVLRSFMRDTGNQFVLGAFIANFLYCILILRTVRSQEDAEFVPHFSMAIAMALAVLGIGVLIYFLHHSANLIHVSNVVARIGLELQHAIESIYPEHIGQQPQSLTSVHVDTDKPVAPIFPDEEELRIPGKGAGYVQAIDNQAILEVAIRHQVVIRIMETPGGFVAPGATLAFVWPADRDLEALREEINNAFIIGNQRTPTQEIGLYFDEMLEIALRALSPGINDPNTALTVINWLTAGFNTLANRGSPSPYRHDKNGILRVITEPESFERLLDHVYDQFRLVASDHPIILRKLLEMAEEIAPAISNEAQRAHLLRHASLVEQTARESGLLAAHQQHEFRAAYEGVVDALRKRADLSSS